MDASTFPISLTYHLVFALIAGIFFLVQFIRLRRPYQLLLAIGISADPRRRSAQQGLVQHHRSV